MSAVSKPFGSTPRSTALPEPAPEPQDDCAAHSDLAAETDRPAKAKDPGRRSIASPTMSAATSRSNANLGPRSSRSSVFTVLGLHGPRSSRSSVFTVFGTGVGFGLGTGLGCGIRIGFGALPARASAWTISPSWNPQPRQGSRISTTFFITLIEPAIHDIGSDWPLRPLRRGRPLRPKITVPILSGRNSPVQVPPLPRHREVVHLLAIQRHGIVGLQVSKTSSTRPLFRRFFYVATHTLQSCSDLKWRLWRRRKGALRRGGIRATSDFTLFDPELVDQAVDLEREHTFQKRPPACYNAAFSTTLHRL